MIAAARGAAPPSRADVAVALVCGTAVGVLAATMPLAAALVVAAPFFVALALVNVQLAVALWIPLMFIEGLPGSRLAPEAVGMAVAVGWASALHLSRIERPFEGLRGLLLALAGALSWFALSLVWARDIGLAAGYAWYFAEVAAFLLIVATVSSDAATVKLFCAMFVLGALLSIAIGLAGLAGVSGSTIEEGSRLQGGAGDPNYFAAALMPALALALGLAAALESPARRFWALAASVPLVLGVAASQSRGALVAAAVMALAALVLFPEKRRALIAGLCTLAAVGGLYFALDQSAWNRITTDRYGGSGRQDLWLVASRVARDHPVIGVGLGNFEVVSPSYVREPGRLTYVSGILRGQEPHNVYLAMLAEAGIIGLLLFVAVPGACLVLALRASRRYARAGMRGMSILARASCVALIGAMTTSFFLPNAADKRAWVLMGIAAGLAHASCRVRTRPAAAHPTPVITPVPRPA